MKTRYLISCAAVAILAGSAVAAHAADATAASGGAPGPGDATATVTDASTDAAASDTTAAVGEIIVTSQRRSENVQAVPMTLTAITANVLAQQNIETLADIVKYTPNVTFGGNGPGQGVIFMRGLSAGVQGNQSSATIATFPNVALYLDDQSMQFPGRNVDVYTVDLERVEVLEGPQGTLFGGGAEAGAIRYITNKPKLERVLEAAPRRPTAAPPAAAPTTWATSSSTSRSSRTSWRSARSSTTTIRAATSTTCRAPSRAPTRTSATPTSTSTRTPPEPARTACPPAARQSLCTIPGLPQGNNFQLAGTNSNPTTYQGARFELLWQVNDDWNVLITESFQNLDAEGISDGVPDRFGLPARWRRCRSPPSVHRYDKDNCAEHRLDGQRQARPTARRLYRRLYGPPHRPAAGLHQLFALGRRHVLRVHGRRHRLRRRRRRPASRRSPTGTTSSATRT